MYSSCNSRRSIDMGAWLVWLGFSQRLCFWIQDIPTVCLLLVHNHKMVFSSNFRVYAPLMKLTERNQLIFHITVDDVRKIWDLNWKLVTMQWTYNNVQFKMRLTTNDSNKISRKKRRYEQITLRMRNIQICASRCGNLWLRTCAHMRAHTFSSASKNTAIFVD